MLPEKPKCSFLIGKKKKQSKRQRLIAHLAAAGMKTTHPFSSRTSLSSAVGNKTLVAHRRLKTDYISGEQKMRRPVGNKILHSKLDSKKKENN